MKLRNIIVITSLIASGSSFGAAGIFDEFLFTSTTGSTPLTFYDIGAVSANQDFNGSNLGSFNLGSTLQLGGQQKSYKNNFTDVTSHTLYWKVSGGFTGVDMPFQSNLITPGDQQWGGDVQGANGSLVLSTNVLSGLTAGNYTLEVYSEIATNGVDAANPIGNVNGGGNYKASFSVVPEPSSALLGGLGVLALLRRRRL